MRLDKKLSELFPKKSRSQLGKLIEKGKVKVNGKLENQAKYKVQDSDVLEVDFETLEERIDLQPENIPLNILFECDDFLVINKEKGISVHPSEDEETKSGTIVNAVMFYCGEFLSGIGGEKRPGIVHRLDKDTTGVLIVAKTDAFHAFLSKEIEERRVKKKYRALVCGHVQAGEIRAAIGRSFSDRKKMSIRKDGKEAITRFELIEYFPEFDVSLVDVDLITGRTHQIRVHFASIGHPVVGDQMYGSKKTNEVFSKKFQISSQLLHAYSYEFCDKTGQIQLFQAPFPSDILDEEKNILREVEKKK